jgi:hypothetical protein
MDDHEDDGGGRPGQAAGCGLPLDVTLSRRGDDPARTVLAAALDEVAKASIVTSKNLDLWRLGSLTAYNFMLGRA